MNVNEKLKTEVLSELEGVSTMALGSEEHGKTVDAVNGMIDRVVKLQQIDAEQRKLDIEREKLELEREKLELEDRKAKNESRNNKVKNVITVVTTGITFVVAVWANIDSKKFEGYHSTEAGRLSERRLLGFMDKLKNNN
jgi:hypothetical protein